MKVCIVVEGTYPYVTGGVSSWIQMLIENLPDISFTVLHLAPWRWDKPFAYRMPENLEAVYEHLLFSADLDGELEKGLESLSETVWDLITYRTGRAQRFIDVVRTLVGRKLDPMLRSKFFWDFLVEVYERFFSEQGFTKFYWTVVGFLLPILSALQSVPPEADIYHATTTGYAGLSAIAGKLVHGGKLIVTEHGIYHREREIEILKSTTVDEIYKPIWISIFRLISQASYELADALTTLFEKNQLFQLELGANFEKMSVIPNGVDTRKFSSISKEPHETFNIAVIGRVVPIKDILTAIKAFEIVAGEVPNARLLVVGPNDEDEEYFERCVELAHTLGLGERVVFTGRANVLEYYRITDVLLISSVSEGQPLVQLEALACGIPSVVTNVGNCAEIALDPDGQSGFVVEPKDYPAMASRLIELARNPELCRVFSENGRRIAQEKYDLRKMVNAYRSLYESILVSGN